MNKPHKHAALIKAWADGAEIQVYISIKNGWVTQQQSPLWFEDSQYRIKPEEPRVALCSLSNWKLGSGMPSLAWNTEMYANKIKLSFDPDSGELLSVEKI